MLLLHAVMSMSVDDLKNGLHNRVIGSKVRPFHFLFQPSISLCSLSFAAVMLSACAGMSPDVQANLATASTQQNAGFVQIANKPEEVKGVPQESLANSYRLGSGDKIRLNVFKETELSGEFEIDGSGSVSLPLVGEVSAKGLTVRELEQKIGQKLQEGYLKDPKVSVDVLNYRPFFILGEVKKGGEYPYKAGLTVRDAVAMAGGYTYRANSNKVVIRRASSNQEQAFDLSDNVLVFPGDNVNIPERFF